MGRARNLPHDSSWSALDADMTTQDVMMEAINDLLAKKGKGPHCEDAMTDHRADVLTH